MSGRYMVTVWHGEHRSIFYVVDSQAPESQQPAVVQSFASPHEAHSFARHWNTGGTVGLPKTDGI